MLLEIEIIVRNNITLTYPEIFVVTPLIRTFKRMSFLLFMAVFTTGESI